MGAFANAKDALFDGWPTGWNGCPTFYFNIQAIRRDLCERYSCSASIERTGIGFSAELTKMGEGTRDSLALKFRKQGNPYDRITKRSVLLTARSREATTRK
jgi:hypothetical protein